MPEKIIKTTFSEFKKFLDSAASYDRVTDDWIVESDNPSFNDFMGSIGLDSDDLISRFMNYKNKESDRYDDIGMNFIYICYDYGDFTDNWNEALDQIKPRPEIDSDSSGEWRREIESMIREVGSAELDEYIYNDAESSDFLIFACDIEDIYASELSTLHAKRA